jgi:K+-transporting ATPase ATPase C chain
MFQHIRACLWLLVLTVVFCSIVYPCIMLGIAKALPNQAEGSLLRHDGKVIGSRLIAQPFNDDRFFKPRPSNPSYNATASTPSNLAGNNYALRDRVAQQLGPIVKYAGGLKKGQLAGGDIETWFQKDILSGQKGIVAQWANLHNGSAQNWVKNGMTASGEYGDSGKYVQDWQKAHKAEVQAEIDRLEAFKKANPDKAAPEPTSEWIKDWIAAISDPSTGPKPEDLAVSFFVWFSGEHPGMFPSSEKQADGKTMIKPLNKANDSQTDIQAIFFDLWLGEHADADLEQVPGDFVTQSGSGLDPHITLKNALWQLENQPIAAAWAKLVAGEKAGDQAKSGVEAKIRGEIKQLLQDKSFAPLGGLVGMPLVNVLEVNLALQEKYEKAK